MTKESFANTHNLRNSPKMDEKFLGIQIEAEETISIRDKFIVYGSFRIPKEEAAKIETQLHKALVLVITRGSDYSASNPFENYVLFQDDEEQIAGCRKGYFNLNIFEYLGTKPSGVFYVMVSMGRFLSNIVRVTVKASGVAS